MIQLALLSLFPVASASDSTEYEAVDVSEYRDSLAAFELPTGELFMGQLGQDFDYFFYEASDGVLHQQLVNGYSADGDERFDVHLVDRRYSNLGYDFERKEDRYFLRCGENEVPLTPIDAQSESRRLERAKFVEPLWRRNAHFLARDDHGIYYLVDKAWMSSDEDPPTESYRVYIGWLGEVLLAPLKLIAQDSMGEVYGVTGSDQRLVVTGDKARFIEGESDRELYPLRQRRDYEMVIYLDKGVHAGKPHGTPCDRFHDVSRSR